jgi:hypothetical protein
MSTVDLLTVLLLAGIALPAQTPPADADTARAKELLNSPSLADRAWGAYYAGRLHDPGLRDILVERLRAAQPLANARLLSAESCYVASLFDALIEIGGAVPLDAFMPFEARWREPALILLSRRQGTEDTLLTIRNESMPDLEWQAVNNLLLGMRSARFFSATLQETRITQVFEVRDGVVGEGQSGGRGGDCAHGIGPQWPQGFPPIGLYYFQDQGTEDQVMAAGPRNVYFMRRVPPDLPTGCEHFLQPPGPDREQLRLEYMKAWNHGSTEVERAFRPRTALQWKDAATAAREAESWLDVQTAAIRAFVAAAERNGARNLAGVSLEIEPTFQDRRHDTLVPLPVVYPRKFTLE